MDVQVRTVSVIPSGLLSSCHHTEDNVLVAMCATGRVIAFLSRGNKAQFIATEDDPDTDSKDYQSAFQGTLDVLREPNQPKPIALACVVIPVAVLSKMEFPHLSSVVVVGFNDGCIGAFSKTGKRIFMQQLHNDSVIKITIMAQPPFADSKSLECSDLAVVFKGGVVCIINGISLAQLIEYNVSKNSLGNPSGDAESLFNMSLMYKKFYLEQQSSTLDIAFLGHCEPSPFDHLREACLVEGHDAAIRYGPSTEAKLIAVGEQPMVSLYRVSKDSGTINVSEVVHEVASRMTSAVLGKLSQASGWFGWSGRKAPSMSAASLEDKQQRTLNLKMSTNISDIRRQVQSIVVSPIGNIAALIDGFGRVILLDTVNLIIRRIWKGYRGVQCAWLKTCDPMTSQRMVQCLCIYLPRGVLEFWPVESDQRVAVLSVEKNCRLLHSYRCIVGKDDCITKTSVVTAFADNALLLCPDGKLLTFEIPFSSVIKRNNALSHDFFLLHKLRESVVNAVDKIDAMFIEISSMVKSSQSLLEVVKLAISCSEHVSFYNLLAVFDIAISRSLSTQSCTVPKEFFEYFVKLKNLSLFYNVVYNVELRKKTLRERLDAESFIKFLSESCGLSQMYSQKVAQLIALYEQTYTLTKHQRKDLNLTDFMACFNIKDCDIHCILPNLSESKATNIARKETDIKLKPGLLSQQLIDLATFVAVPLLSMYEERSNSDMLNESPISPETLIYLLIKFVLNGALNIASVSLYSLYTVLGTLVGVLLKDSTIYESIIETLSACHLHGHALILACILQHLITQKLSEVEDNEWEDITYEKQTWIHLCEGLELLTSLSLVTGVDNMQIIPPVLHIAYDEDWMNDCFLNSCILRFDILEDEKLGVCVDSLKKYGSPLLGHCIARSLVDRKFPAKLFVDVRMTSLKGDLESSLTLLQRLQILIDTLPCSLSKTNLLMYCAFDAAFQWSIAKNKNEHEGLELLLLAIDYIKELPSPLITKGICSFLWHIVLERELFHLLEAIRKECVTRSSHITRLLWVCRSIIHFLEQVSLQPLSQNADKMKDNIQLSSPSGIFFLPKIVNHFPQLDSTVILLAVQLLLHAEIVLDCNISVNIFTYYSPAVYSGLKKGLFHFKKDVNQVNKALMLKRSKFLCGAVCVLLNSNQLPYVDPCAMFVSLGNLAMCSSSCYCHVDQFKDLVFSLASLWNLGLLDIQNHWVANLVAAGFTNKGIEVFRGIEDKNVGCVALLPVVGQLCLHLLDNVNKLTHLHVVSQIPPSVLEWMRRQKSAIALIQINPVLKDLVIFIEVLRPHAEQSTSINELIRLLNLLSQ